MSNIDSFTKVDDIVSVELTIVAGSVTFSLKDGKLYTTYNYEVPLSGVEPTIPNNQVAQTDDDKFVIKYSDSDLESKVWYDDEGRYHRDNDMPARITITESSRYQHGKLHRDNDKPAR